MPLGSDQPGNAITLRAATLRAIIRQLIPADEVSGAFALDIETTVTEDIRDLDEFLSRLSAFTGLDWTAQIAELERSGMAEDPIFAELVDLVHRRFYADPRSWPALGYSPGSRRAA
jgi:hypothetical protein